MTLRRVRLDVRRWFPAEASPRLRRRDRRLGHRTVSQDDLAEIRAQSAAERLEGLDTVAFFPNTRPAILLRRANCRAATRVHASIFPSRLNMGAVCDGTTRTPGTADSDFRQACQRLKSVGTTTRSSDSASLAPQAATFKRIRSIAQGLIRAGSGETDGRPRAPGFCAGVCDHPAAPAVAPHAPPFAADNRLRFLTTDRGALQPCRVWALRPQTAYANTSTLATRTGTHTPAFADRSTLLEY